MSRLISPKTSIFCKNSKHAPCSIAGTMDTRSSLRLWGCMGPPVPFWSTCTYATCHRLRAVLLEFHFDLHFTNPDIKVPGNGITWFIQHILFGTLPSAWSKRHISHEWQENLAAASFTDLFSLFVPISTGIHMAGTLFGKRHNPHLQADSDVEEIFTHPNSTQFTVGAAMLNAWIKSLGYGKSKSLTISNRSTFRSMVARLHDEIRKWFFN